MAACTSVYRTFYLLRAKSSTMRPSSADWVR
jgi:hypothetical protein